MAKKNEYNKDEIEFMRAFYPQKGATWCAKELGRKSFNIYNLAKRLNLQFIKKTNFDLTLLTPISNQYLIYLLGFWWADANISPTTLFLEIEESDAVQIKEIYKQICNFSIYIRPKRINDKQTNTLLICQKSLCSILKQYDYDEKSFNEPFKILAAIPKEYHYLWWRGFFDGDGNVRVDTKGRYGFNMSGNVSRSWVCLKHVLKYLKIKFSLYKSNPSKSQKYSAIICQNKDGFKKFFNYIYKNRDIDEIGLLRKYEKCKQGLRQMEQFEQGSTNGRKSISLLDKKHKKLHTFRSISDASKFISIESSKLYHIIRKNSIAIDENWEIIYNN